MNIQIEFELTLEDWKEVVWLHRRRSAPGDQPLRWVSRFGVGAAAFGFLLLIQRLDGGGWVAPLALILFGLFVPLQMMSARDAQTKEAWAKAERRIHPITWSFDDSRVQSNSVHYQVTYHWALFTSWSEGPTVIALYLTEDNFQTIPKRAFTDPGQLDDFRRLLNAHMITASTGGFPIKTAPPAAT